MKSWRKNRTWKDRLAEEGFNNNPSPYPPTKIFDNLAFIGDETVNCFLLETSAGPVLIDLMWPGKKYRDIIENGLNAFCYKAEDISAILITHGHIDHYGDVEYFRRKSGAKIYMTETDFELAKKFVPQKAVPADVDGVAMELGKCEFVEDMQNIVIGDTTVKAVLTPGHTPGGLSFIFPVYDEGRRHMAAMWGGNTVPSAEKDIYVFLESLDKFSRICDKLNVDVELSNHAFVDNPIERLNVIRNICNGVPNPFVIGKEAYKRYEQLFVELAERELKEKRGK